MKSEAMLEQTMRIYKLNIPASKRLDEINAASAFVFNECLKLKEMWDYQSGYPSSVRT